MKTAPVVLISVGVLLVGLFLFLTFHGQDRFEPRPEAPVLEVDGVRLALETINLEAKDEEHWLLALRLTGTNQTAQDVDLSGERTRLVSEPVGIKVPLYFVALDPAPVLEAGETGDILLKFLIQRTKLDNPWSLQVEDRGLRIPQRWLGEAPASEAGDGSAPFEP